MWSVQLCVSDLLSAFTLLMLYFCGHKFLRFISQFRERTELQSNGKEEERGFSIKCANKYPVSSYTICYLVDTLVQGGYQFLGDQVHEFNTRPL